MQFFLKEKIKSKINDFFHKDKINKFDEIFFEEKIL